MDFYSVQIKRSTRGSRREGFSDLLPTRRSSLPTEEPAEGGASLEARRRRHPPLRWSEEPEIQLCCCKQSNLGTIIQYFEKYPKTFM